MALLSYFWHPVRTHICSQGGNFVKSFFSFVNRSKFLDPFPRGTGTQKRKQETQKLSPFQKMALYILSCQVTKYQPIFLSENGAALHTELPSYQVSAHISSQDDEWRTVDGEAVILKAPKKLSVQTSLNHWVLVILSIIGLSSCNMVRLQDQVQISTSIYKGWCVQMAKKSINFVEKRTILQETKVTTNVVVVEEEKN